MRTFLLERFVTAALKPRRMSKRECVEITLIRRENIRRAGREGEQIGRGRGRLEKGEVIKKAGAMKGVFGWGKKRRFRLLYV